MSSSYSRSRYPLFTIPCCVAYTPGAARFCSVKKKLSCSSTHSQADSNPYWNLWGAGRGGRSCGSASCFGVLPFKANAHLLLVIVLLEGAQYLNAYQGTWYILIFHAAARLVRSQVHSKNTLCADDCIPGKCYAQATVSQPNCQQVPQEVQSARCHVSRTFRARRKYNPTSN